jgi:hypothetical protein
VTLSWTVLPESADRPAAEPGYVSRLALMVTSALKALIGAVTLMVTQ